MERRKQQARLTHNTTIPFNSLPTEIGNTIFTISLRNQGVKDYQRLLRLRLVCTLWSAAIDAESSFWTLMFNELQRTAWQNSLTKSHQSPLLFVWYGHYFTEEYLREFPRQEFLDTVASQIHRTGLFCFASGTSWPSPPKLRLEESLTIKSIMSSEAPLLEELMITSDEPDPTVTITFSGNMPRMKVVQLLGWAASLLDGATLGNLQALKLTGSPRQIPLQRLATTVLAALNLIHLDIAEKDEEFRQPGGPPPVAAKEPGSGVPALLSLKTVAIS